MKITYVISTIKSWNIDAALELQKNDLDHNWVIISDKKDLTTESLKELNPRYIFFPHWSWIIPEDIFSTYECVVFHMTDLPYGRGGSPLQNLIVRGHDKTFVSAIRVVREMDAGDVYMKQPVSLAGTADDILQRVSKCSFEMIKEIIVSEPVPSPQVGDVPEFKRRKPEEGSLAPLASLQEVYNHIRMLDGEGYPRAFLETEHMRFEFEDAEITNEKLVARVTIKKKI